MVQEHVAFAVARNWLWPPGSSAQNDVKHAAAMLLYTEPGYASNIGNLGNKLSQYLGVQSVRELLKAAGYAMSIQQLLQGDPAFIAGKRSTVRLNLPYVLARVPLNGQPMAPLPPPMPVFGAPFPPVGVPMGGMGPMGGGFMGGARGPGPQQFGAPAGFTNAAWQEDRHTFQPQQEQHDDCYQQPTDQYQHQEQMQMQHKARGPSAHSAHQLPAQFQMHPQQEQDGSYTMYLSEVQAGQQQGRGQGSGGGRRKVRAVRGRHGGQGASAGQQEQAGQAADDVESLLQLLPTNKRLLSALAPYTQPDSQPFLVDLAADLGRNITLRLSDKSSVQLPLKLDMDQALSRLQAAGGGSRQSPAKPTTRAAARRGSAAGGAGGGIMGSPAGGRRGSFFSDTNRLGVPGSLHRISAMRDRAGAVYGLTYRVGRHVPGVAELLADVLSSLRDKARRRDGSSRGSDSSSSSLVPAIRSQPGKGLLLVGPPGVGKTTLLRDVARLMSVPEEQGGLGMSVVVVDTSNEIAGDCDMPHPCIGNARRMMVPARHQQAAVMIEAVMNHTPEVIIVDEIATKEEAAACRTIAARGVLLVSTAHGSSLGDLLRNPDLQGLVGGVKAVTLGDRLAQHDNRGQKTRLERGGAVTFGSLVEILDTNKWRLHPDVAASVDCLLAHSHTTGSSTTDLDLAPHTPAGVDTQLRSRAGAAADSQLLVSFESGKVPSTAAWLDGREPTAEWAAPHDTRYAQQQQHMGGWEQQHHQQQQVGGKRARRGSFHDQGGYQQHHHHHHYQQQQQQPRKKARVSGGGQHHYPRFVTTDRPGNLTWRRNQH